jgi:hypothetical protein
MVRLRSMKTNKTNKTQSSKPAKESNPGGTRADGQNPKARDATDQDVYHDDNRRNMYDPEVGEALKGKGAEKPS